MKKRIFCLCLVLCLLSACFITVSASEKADGTKASPYLIGSKEDLLAFAAAVNAGNGFEGEYFLQTADIDLAGVEWQTIGPYGTECSFLGTYNGGGHIIRNLSVTVGGNNSFFGQLGGTVMNLGLEGGTVSGACTGGITSHSSRPTAKIINCYSKITVNGARVGGIADNFNGTIANCLSECELNADSAENVGGIVSYGAMSLIDCISIEPDGRSGNRPHGSTYVDSTDADLETVAKKLNQSLYNAALASGTDYRELNRWTVSEDGQRIVFSSETGSLQGQSAGAFLGTGIRAAAPYLLICGGCFALFAVFFKAKKKTNEE